MKNFCLTMIIAAFCLQFSTAQRTISGMVTDVGNKQPLIGASVLIAGTSLGTVTDLDGKFVIEAPAGATSITVSFVGYASANFPITGTDHIDVSLSQGTDLNEVVVVGYTTEKKKDLKGAVSVVKVNEALKENNANLLSSLQGRVPGLEISTDGAPGSGVTVNLRGLGSFNNNTPPLFIVDGVPTYDINGLSPNDIESLQVLRDAASAAIYGARASSGVIIITTKKGKSASAKVTFDAFYGVKTRRNTLQMLNAQQYGDVLFQGFKNDGVAPSDPIYGSGASATIPAFLDPPKNTTPSANTNWLNELFQPALNMGYNFGVSKGDGKSNFYFGLNYNKEEGLLKYTFYDRLTARINSSFKVGDRITIGENLSIGYLTGNRENESRALEASVVQLPIIPVRDNLGNFAGPFSSLGDYRNPLGDLYRYKDNVSKGWRTFGNVYADVEILKGLTYRASLAVDNVNSGLKFFSNRYVMGRFSSDVNSLTQTDNKSLNLTSTHTLTYNFKKEKHELQLLAGYEWIHNTSEFLSATANNFYLEDPNYIYLGAGTPVSSDGSGSEYGLIGQFANANYSYDSRYLFGASVRRDGSSRFGSSNRYGVFPAFSGAWRISDEPFFSRMDPAKNVSDLKLRASWGQNGNDNIKNYNYASFYGPSINYANYDILGQNSITNWKGATGFIVSSLGNPNTKWEAIQQTNFGFDLGMFNNRLYVSADYYIKKSNDLLYQVQLPAAIGEGTPPFINVGNIENKGFEMLVSYKGQTKGQFGYNFDFTLTSNSNKVLSVGLDGKDIQYPGQHIIQKGLSLDEFYGYVNDGIFQNQAEVDAAPKQDGKGVGRLRFRDVNGDGIVDAKDRVSLGSPLPKVILGLNSNFKFGDFDFSFFIDAKLGQKIWDQTKTLTEFLGYPSNHSAALLNAWSPTNTGSSIPQLSNNNANFDKVNSSYFVKDGSFVRLKSVSFGYSIPGSILKNAHISHLRVYVQAENLLILQAYKGYDFETLNADLGSLGVVSLSNYPHSQAISFGLNTSF